MNLMNMRRITLALLALGWAGTVDAGEPFELSDDQLDHVVAGDVNGGLAFAFSSGSYSAGRTGYLTSSAYGSVTRTETGTSSGTTGTWWTGSAGTANTAYAAGPGATSASVGLSGSYLAFY
jgi:hypothetical protein